MFVFHCNPPAALELSSSWRHIFPPKFPTKIPSTLRFPEHMADLRFRGREFMSSTFPGGRQDGKSTAGAVPDAEILRAIFCHHQTQKEPRREGAGRGSRERRTKKPEKETDERRQGAAAAGQGGRVRDTRESLRAEGARRPARAQGTLGSARNLGARVTALDLARAREGPRNAEPFFL